MSIRVLETRGASAILAAQTISGGTLKIPLRIKVGAHVYEIRMCPAKEMKDREAKEELHGTCDPGTNLIRIRKRLKRSVQQETLLHELLHACSYPSLFEKTLTDEDFVTSITPTLLQVLQDNPDLAAYLTS